MGPDKWSRMRAALVDPSVPPQAVAAVKVLNGRTGAVENALPFANFHRFLRSRLRGLLAEGLSPGALCFGRRLVGVEYEADGGSGGGGGSVVARFADGTSERGRLLVGADGSQSAVRTVLLGERAALKRLPFAATFISASFEAPQARFLRAYHPILNVIIHPDDMVGMLALLDAAPVSSSSSSSSGSGSGEVEGGGEGAEDGEHDTKPAEESWRFTFYISWRSPVSEQAAEAAAGMGPRERLAQAKRRAAQFADPLRSCHDWVPDDLAEVYWGGVANWDPSLPDHEWDNHGGLVTLMGDAAHPMTYHRGQGLNHAIADAAKLVELLSATDKRPQRERVDAYEAEMRPRGGEEVRLSEMNSYMLHDWPQVAQSPLMKRQLSFGSGGGGGGGGQDTEAASAASAEAKGGSAATSSG
ncbi:hypothetical protein F5B20DRAFT_538415 [Whalleya microplaca]|nr:hypothetical protein F5B20DRAFT_538415 [Whalleya microplaca]